MGEHGDSEFPAWSTANIAGVRLKEYKNYNKQKLKKLYDDTKNAAYEGSTFYAQGGIAAVLDDKDTTDSHKQDTMDAGAGLCREEAVAFTVNHAKEAIDWLVDQGVEFDKRSDKHPGDFHLTQEGGHSHRRILHAADATGKAVSSALLKQASSMPNITFFEHHIAVDLIKYQQRCCGIYVLDQQRDEVDILMR